MKKKVAALVVVTMTAGMLSVMALANGDEPESAMGSPMMEHMMGGQTNMMGSQMGMMGGQMGMMGGQQGMHKGMPMMGQHMMGMMGMMRQHMMKPQITPLADGGVLVSTGNLLLKYDKDLNLVKKVQIDITDQDMQQMMKTMKKHCNMYQQMYQQMMQQPGMMGQPEMNKAK